MSDDAIETWLTVLRCDYFGRIARRVLSPKFAEEEFFERSAGLDSEHITYCGPTGYIDVSYESEPLPPHRVTVFIGRGERLANSEVPAWFVIPEGESARNYWQWTFTDEHELEVVLQRIWDEVILPFAVPTAINQRALNESIVRFGRYADTIR